MYCKHCGIKILDKRLYCPECGKRLEVDDENNNNGNTDVDFEAIAQSIETAFKDFTENTLPKIISALQWMIDNKPYGFDVQDIRLAGVRARVESCRKRILDYLDGKVERIEELECEILPYGAKEKSLLQNGAPSMMTNSVL